MHVAESRSTALYPAANPNGRPLTAEELWKLRRVGAPVPTPDGAAIIVPVTSYDVPANKGLCRLWLVPVDGAAPRPLTSEEHSSSEPAISPEGARICFVRGHGEEKPQLYVMSLDGGEAERLTDFPLGVVDPNWFPDGRRVAFVAMLYAEAPTVEGTRELQEKRSKDPVKVHITEDRIYRFWDRWLTGGEMYGIALAIGFTLFFFVMVWAHVTGRDDGGPWDG